MRLGGVAILEGIDLALAAHAAVRRSLARTWPPRFAPQSLVLSQLQATRTYQLIARAARLPMRGEADAFECDRLLAALHDRPDAVRPRRSLRPPPADAKQWRALAWRAASAWARRHTWPHPASVATTLGAAAAALGVGGYAAGLWPSSAPQTGFVDPGNAFGQGVLIAAAVFGAAILLATVGVVLEKYGSWSGVGASGWEAQLVAALVAAATTMLATAFGVPGLAPIGSAVVLAIAWLLPV